jgi:mitogen-activated protein kinase organizer 1
MTTGGGDKQVFLWDVATGQKIRRFRGHDAAVNAVSFAADDQVVVSAGYDRAVKFWDVRSNSIDAIQSVCAWKDSVTSLAITRNHCVTAASVDGSIRTMDLRAGRATADALGSEHPITSVRASGDERCFLLSVLGGRCVLLDRGDGDVLAEYRGHVHDEGAFVFTLVPIRPRWRGERRSLRPLPDVSLRPGSLAFNPRPRRLSTPKSDAFQRPSVSVESRLTRDDSHVASGSEDGKVVFWDLVEANIAATIDAHPGKACVSLAMHPTKDAMATCGTDGVARLWGPTAGRGVF